MRSRAMTHQEAVAAVQVGKRVTGEHSLHAEAKTPCVGCCRNWRTLYCDSETDVVECAECGRQSLARCNFDDEYA